MRKPIALYYTKTGKMVSITQRLPGSCCTIDRRIYEDEYGNEFVKVNCYWVSLEHYETDKHFDVHRFY